MLDLLAGRYPSEEFAELRPRIVWDRVDGHRAGPGRRPAPGRHQRRHHPRPRPVHASSCPTAPGWASSTRRWSTRAGPGETFLLGASTWRIEDITFERVIVTPAPGQPGKMPFWHGDGPGRPLELGRAIGAFTRELRAARTPTADRPAARPRRPRRAGRRATWSPTSTSRPRPPAPCPTTARSWSSASATRSATGGSACCRPFGAQVHAPWAMALQHRLGRALGRWTSS